MQFPAIAQSPMGNRVLADVGFIVENRYETGAARTRGISCFRA